MAKGYEIKESGELVFNKPHGIDAPNENLWKEYIQLEYEVLNNHHNPTKDLVKIARYNELKKQLNIDDKASADAFNKAIEKIKREMIVSDESPDNSVLYAALAKFKKTNG